MADKEDKSKQSSSQNETEQNKEQQENQEQVKQEASEEKLDKILGAASQLNPVLIIDDDKWIGRVIAQFVGERNFKTFSATDPLDGIAMAIKHKPSLIFLDILMPEVNGYTMLKLFKKIEVTQEIPIIVVSGNLNKELLKSAYNSGASSFISKPITKEVLFLKMYKAYEPVIDDSVDIDLIEYSQRNTKSEEDG